MAGRFRKMVRQSADWFVRLEASRLAPGPHRMDEIGRPIIVATHRRSGTHMTMDTLRRNFPACWPRMLPLENIHNSYLSLDRFETGHFRPVSEQEALRILKKAERPTIKTHGEIGLGRIDAANRRFVDAVIAESDTLYIARDGRRVMCSLWAWFAGGPSRRTPFSDFIRQTDVQGRSRPRQWADHVLGWFDAPGVVSYRFEDLVASPERTLGEIGERFGISLRLADPIIPHPVRSSLQMWRAHLTGDLTSTNQYPPGRRSPKPEEVFGADDVSFFGREAGEAMERLGYEAPTPMTAVAPSQQAAAGSRA